MKQNFILPQGSTVRIITTVTDSKGHKTQTVQNIIAPGKHTLPPLARANAQRATPL